jgi:BASS family bile acid:Na+ symporter
MNSVLAFAGRHGPLLLFFGVVIGFVFPTLAAAAKPWMGASVFVFTLGAFLKVDRSAFRAELRRPLRAAAVLVWTLAGVPAVAWALVQAASLPAEIGLAIMLCMLGPPVGSAAAMAAMLGLNAGLALAATIVISVLAPFYLPPIAALIGGSAAQIDAVAMLGRIVAVIGAAAGTAVLLRRFAGAFVVRNPSAMTGVSVVGLLAVAIGAMHDMPQHVLGHGMQALQLIGLAFTVNIGFQFLGFVLFSRLGVADALTVGLVSGNRNVTLVWVVVAPWLGGLPLVEAYLAASVFPIFMLPLLTKMLFARWPMPALPEVTLLKGRGLVP